MGSLDAEKHRADANKGSLDAALYRDALSIDEASGNLPSPDFYAPFNEGLEIDRGYGNLDANGNRAVEFTRDSSVGNINKSGVVVALASDEPAISGDGLSCFDSFTNDMLWSEDATTVPYAKVGVSVTPNAAIAPDGTMTADKLTATLSDSYMQQFFTPGTELPNGSVWLRSDVVTEISLHFVGGVVKPQPITVTTDWRRFEIEGEDLAHNVLVVGGFNAFSTGESVYWWGQQVTKTKSIRPYAKTTTAAATVSATQVGIPVMNNLPAFGKPFTIISDVADTSQNKLSYIFGSVADGTSAIECYLGGDGLIYFRVSDGASLILCSILASGGKERVACRFDGQAIRLFSSSGSTGSESAMTMTSYPLNSTMTLGSLGSINHLNAGLAKFKVYFEALTEAQLDEALKL